MIIADNRRFTITNPDLRKSIHDYNLSQNSISFSPTNYMLLKLIESNQAFTPREFHDCLAYVTNDLSDELLSERRNIKTLNAYGKFIISHKEISQIDESACNELITKWLEITIKHVSSKKVEPSDIKELENTLDKLENLLPGSHYEIITNHYDSLKLVIKGITQQFEDQEKSDQNFNASSSEVKSDMVETYTNFFSEPDSSTDKSEDYEKKLVQDIPAVSEFLLNSANLRLDKLIEFYTIFLKHKPPHNSSKDDPFDNPPDYSLESIL